MFSTANTYKLTLPDSSEIVFGIDKTDTDWVGLVGPNGVTSSVELIESKDVLARGDGEILGTSYWGSRSIVADIFIPENDPEKRSDYLEKLQKVTTMIRADGILSWQEQGTGTISKQIPVRLQSFPTITHNSNPTKAYQIVMTAQQPQIDSATLSTSNNNSAGTFSITNSGNWTAYPYIKITGDYTQLTDLRIKNNTTGEELNLEDTTIASTEWISIYNVPKERRVIKETSSTQANYYDKLVIGSDFISLAPGSNSITYTVVSGSPSPTAPVVSLSWRGAYM